MTGQFTPELQSITKAKDISLMYPWSIERWDIKLGKAMGTKADAKALNAFLEIIRLKVL